MSFLFLISWGQQATVKGVVKDLRGVVIEDVSISYGDKGTTSDSKGYFELTIPANKEIALVFKHIGFAIYGEKIRTSLLPFVGNTFF